MRITFVLLAFLGMCTSSAIAQVSGSAAQCNRGWLASDWPTVAVACAQTADQLDAEAKRYTTEAVDETKSGAPDSVARGALQISIYDFSSAAMYRAKEAVGYYKLKRLDLYGAARDMAANELTIVINEAPTVGASAGLAPELLAYLRSGSFPETAQRSILLTAPP